MTSNYKTSRRKYGKNCEIELVSDFSNTSGVKRRKLMNVIKI